MAWIRETLSKQQADEDLIWKVSSMHHPMFGLHIGDYKTIINDYLPLIQEANYDFYFNGHEHQLNYAHVPYTSEYVEQGPLNLESGCKKSIEWFPENGPEKDTRRFSQQQGESIH